MNNSLDEILATIHRHNLETQVFEYLSDWVIADRADAYHRASQYKQTIGVTYRLADSAIQNKLYKIGLESVKNACKEGKEW